MSKKDKRDVLFAISARRVEGGYEARARLRTSTGFILLAARAQKKDHVSGVRSQSAAVGEVLQQAATICGTMTDDKIPSSARFAVETTLLARELSERASAGDGDAKRMLARMADSDSPVIRKAVHAQRIFGEK